jgi:hypothetical protein
MIAILSEDINNNKRNYHCHRNIKDGVSPCAYFFFNMEIIASFVWVDKD